jgi:hypothetical protein
MSTLNQEPRLSISLSLHLSHITKIDKKLLFKRDLNLTETMPISQDFFVFFDFPEKSQDWYYKKLR